MNCKWDSYTNFFLMPNAKAAASRHACIFLDTKCSRAICDMRSLDWEAGRAVWWSIWVVLHSFHTSSWFTRSSLSFSVSLRLSAHSLSPDAMTWWASAGSCGLACLLYLWPFDLLNNLPGIWYYDVTMEAVKNSPYEYSRIRLLSLQARVWISSRECSRRALSLPAMNNWTIEDRVVYSPPCISDHDQIKFLPSNIVNLILNLMEGDLLTCSAMHAAGQRLSPLG